MHPVFVVSEKKFAKLMKKRLGNALRGKPKLMQLRNRVGELKSPNHYIQYFDGDRSQRITTNYKIGEQDIEANQELARFTLKQANILPWAADQQLDLKITRALTQYYDEHARFLTTWQTMKLHRDRLRRAFPIQFISQITQGQINKYVRDCQKEERSDATTRRELEFMRASFNYAEGEKRITRAPKFRLPPAPPPRDRNLLPEEVQTLLTECHRRIFQHRSHTYKHLCYSRLYHFTLLMLNNGQRPGAVEGLTWPQVDFDTRMVNWRRIDRRESKKRARAVPMNDVTYEILWDLGSRKTSFWVFGWPGSKAGTVKKSFASVCRHLGFKKVGRHTLRHTFGTESHVRGMSDKDISDIMGHTTTKTTTKDYIHTRINKLRETVNSMQVTAQNLHNRRAA